MKFPDWLTLAADLSSLLSLLLTGIVWIQTRSIKQAVMSRARLPQIQKTIERQSNVLISKLTDWPSADNEAYAQINETLAVLQNLLPKLSSSDRQQPKRVIKIIQTRTAIWQGWSQHSESEKLKRMLEIHWGLRGVIETLRQINEDQKKRV